MGIVVNEIKDKASKLFLNIKYLTLPEYQLLFKNIVQKFTVGTYSYPLWEQINSSVSKFDPNGWKFIKNFIEDAQVILFLEEHDDAFACIFQNGEDINHLLSETFGFVFYITNINLDYVICFNDHDFLIGAGSAKKWMNELWAGAGL